MPASRVSIEVEEGVPDLYCPACAAPVYTQEEGTAEQTCEHVRFFIDWEGELSLAEPDSFAGEDAERQQRIIDLVEQTDSWDEFLDKVVTVLPGSAMVLELSQPDRAGGEGEGEDDEEGEGGTAVVAFDFASPELAEDE
ncbi:MAG: hypothetical protein ACXWZS_02450 [Gemmatirosa sp.]